MTNLAPCPFCGCSASIERYGDRSQSTIYQCDNCSCSLETGEEFNHGAKWNRRIPIEAGNGGDGWLDIASAPKDSQIIAISWQEGYGSFESNWSKPEVYEWDEMHSYWANKQRGICIWPKYQHRYRCKSLGRAPPPPSPSNEGEKP